MPLSPLPPIYSERYKPAPWDDCWVDAGLMGIHAQTGGKGTSGRMPTVTEIRAAAGRPDHVGTAEGGNVAAFCQAYKSLTSGLHFTLYPTKAALRAHLAEGGGAWLGGWANNLPRRDRAFDPGFYDNAGRNQHSVYVQGEGDGKTVYELNPEMPNGTAPTVMTVDDAMRFVWDHDSAAGTAEALLFYLPHQLASAPVPAPAPKPAAEPGWTFGAIEGGSFIVPDNSLVRYGAGTTYVTKVMSGTVSCSNATFGDPLKGTVKHCDYQPAPTPAPVPAPAPTPAPAPAPDPVAVLTAEVASLRDQLVAAHTATTQAQADLASAVSERNTATGKFAAAATAYQNRVKANAALTAADQALAGALTQ